MTCPATYGEHNEQVFKDILGMSVDEIADFIASGDISTEGDFNDMIARMLGLK